jgi:urea transport system ATP-binding protein
MTMLSVENLNQYYGGSHILRNVGLEARLGEVTVILGRNGVGKTTLLKSLMGVVPVKAGRITLDGQDITHATSYERVRGGVGYVPQGREIFGRLTVEDNLRMGLATKPGATPIRLFSSVVLPTPLRPSTTVTSPIRASKPTPRRMCEPP